jgi:hypothetical protein
MNKIDVILEICTLFNGIPNGIALIQFTHPNFQKHSFKGVGVFEDGKLHNGPFSCIEGTGAGYSFSNMMNGRPAENSFMS